MSETQTTWADELEVAKAAARAAGAAVMEFYTKHSAEHYVKKDGSVVTDADLAADRIIRAAILDAFPHDALLTEEGVDNEDRLRNQRVWIVDPIDGTNQFVDQTGEFDVFIALVVDERPVVAVAFQPTADTLLSAVAGQGATIERHGSSEPLRFTPVPGDQPPRLMTSIWFGYPENLPFLERVAVRLGGPPPQFCTIGISPRRIMPGSHEADAVIGYQVGQVVNPHNFAWEWDFAAPDLIINEAGGKMTNLLGHEHRYNKRLPRNEGGVIFSVDPITHSRVVDAIALERATEN